MTVIDEIPTHVRRRASVVVDVYISQDGPESDALARSYARMRLCNSEGEGGMRVEIPIEWTPQETQAILSKIRTKLTEVVTDNNLQPYNG